MTRLVLVCTLLLLCTACVKTPADAGDLQARAEDFLAASYGADVARSNIAFIEAHNESYAWGGSAAQCNMLIADAIRDGPKQQYVYTLNGYLPEDTVVSVVFDEQGELYCVRDVLNCTGRPWTCPPYLLNSTAAVYETLQPRCGGFDNVLFQPAAQIKNPVWPPARADIARLNDAGYVWVLVYHEGCAKTDRNCRGQLDVLADPKTGAIVSDPKHRCG